MVPREQHSAFGWFSNQHLPHLNAKKLGFETGADRPIMNSAFFTALPLLRYLIRVSLRPLQISIDSPCPRQYDSCRRSCFANTVQDFFRTLEVKNAVLLLKIAVAETSCRLSELAHFLEQCRSYPSRFHQRPAISLFCSPSSSLPPPPPSSFQNQRRPQIQSLDIHHPSSKTSQTASTGTFITSVAHSVISAPSFWQRQSDNVFLDAAAPRLPCFHLHSRSRLGVGGTSAIRDSSCGRRAHASGHMVLWLRQSRNRCWLLQPKNEELQSTIGARTSIQLHTGWLLGVCKVPCSTES